MKNIIIMTATIACFCAVANAELSVRISGLGTVARLAKESYEATYKRDPQDKQKPDEKTDKPRYSWAKLNEFVRQIEYKDQQTALVHFSGPLQQKSASFNCNIVVQNPSDSGEQAKHVTIVQG